MKKSTKRIISLLLTLSMLIIMGTTVFANNIPSIGTASNENLKKIGSNALGYVQWFGYAMAVGMLLYIGIKYMMASANEKADLKKGSISYVIGAIIVVAASTLFGILSSIAGEVVVS